MIRGLQTFGGGIVLALVDYSISDSAPISDKLENQSSISDITMPPIAYQATDIFSRIYQLVTQGKDVGGPVLLPSEQTKNSMMQLAFLGVFIVAMIFALRYVFKS